MELVIDANVVHGHYQELLNLGADIGLTDSTLLLFQRLGYEDTVYADDGGQIKHEWRRVVEPEWFDRWFQELLRIDAVQLIPVDNKLSKAHIRKIEQLGFPNSRDRWYIRVAVSANYYFDNCTLVTEDIDFYDPARKSESGEKRLNRLRLGNGSVARYLKRKAKIEVVCVETYNGIIESVNDTEI